MSENLPEVSSIKIMYKKLNGAYFEEVNGQLKVVSDPNILRQLKTGQLRAEQAPAISGGAERFKTPERTLTPLGEDRSLDDTPTERTLPTGTSPLTDFADTLSKATDLARKKRNRMTMELLGERFDPSAEPASGFAGILSDINRASQRFTGGLEEEVLDRAFPEEDKLNTQVIDVGGRKLLINKLTGDTIKDLGGNIQLENLGGYTDTEKRKLRAVGIDPNNIEEADGFLYKGIMPITKLKEDIDFISKIGIEQGADEDEIFSDIRNLIIANGDDPDTFDGGKYKEKAGFFSKFFSTVGQGWENAKETLF